MFWDAAPMPAKDKAPPEITEPREVPAPSKSRRRAPSGRANLGPATTGRRSRPARSFGNLQDLLIRVKTVLRVTVICWALARFA